MERPGTRGLNSEGLWRTQTVDPSPCAPIGNRSQPTATVLACFGAFRADRFAIDCHRLRPLGSITAPYSAHDP